MQTSLDIPRDEGRTNQTTQDVITCVGIENFLGSGSRAPYLTWHSDHVTTLGIIRLRYRSGDQDWALGTLRCTCIALRQSFTINSQILTTDSETQVYQSIRGSMIPKYPVQRLADRPKPRQPHKGAKPS
jgi:hypothetical protein